MKVENSKEATEDLDEELEQEKDPAEETLEEEDGEAPAGENDEKDGEEKEVESDVEKGADGKPDYEKSYKALQSKFNQRDAEIKELRDLRDKLNGSNIDTLKNEIDSLKKSLNDEDYLARKLQAAQKKKEEDETLTPEQKEIRLLRREIDLSKEHIKRQRASEYYSGLMSKDNFIAENDAEIAKMLAGDPKLEKQVIEDPQIGFDVIRGRLSRMKPGKTREEIAKEIEEERQKKIAQAKKKKTVIEPAGGGGGRSDKVDEVPSFEDLIDEFETANPDKRL